MSEILISNEEYELLEKRGFFVRDNNSFLEFLKSNFAITILVNFIGYIAYYIFSADDIVSYYILIILLMLYAIPLTSYAPSSKIYYTKDGIVGFGMSTKEDIIDSKIDEIPFMWNFLKKILQEINIFAAEEQEKKSYNLGIIGIIYVLAIMGAYNLSGFFGIYQNSPNLINIIINIIVSVGLMLSFVWFFTLFGYFMNKFINISHPLYAFGNIGEKIQELTPEIEEQSQKIESEFQSDMNFSVLSNGFDSLSIAFSEIVGLVIKLEKAEIPANTGNLFDSEKYINSLRSDIIEPLRSLREFFENQKSKLLESQKELMQVRVGGNEASGNIELQSKRSELLIQELTENIEKLDVMIKKMGK